jgi:hypothetical protein
MADNVSYFADLFSQVETSGDTSREYLQLEKPMFSDMVKMGFLPKESKYEDYVTIKNGKRFQTNPEKYKEATMATYEFLSKVFGIETPEEAALFLYRPAYYKKYGGNVENIPDDKKGSFGKSAKEVMRQRYQTLKKQGYLK